MTTPIERVTPAQGMRQALTLAWRGLVPLKNAPGQLLGYVLQPLVMIFVFVYIFGGAANGGERASVVLYAIPGVVVQGALVATTATGLNLFTDLDNGVFDRLRALPIARSAVLTGRILTDAVGVAIAAVASLLIGYAFGFRVATGPFQAIAGLLVVTGFAMAVSVASAYLGLVAKSVTGIQLLGFAVFIPISMGSNAYMSPEAAPGWLRAWIEVNPVSHLVSGLRAMMLGGAYTARLGTELLWIAGWAAGLIVVFAPLALRAYRRRI